MEDRRWITCIICGKSERAAFGGDTLDVCLDCVIKAVNDHIEREARK